MAKRKAKLTAIAKRSVLLRGIRPIMFDRYAGDNKTQLRTEDKMYYAEDGKTLVLPSQNIMSFLTSENTQSAPRRLLGRQYKTVAQAVKSFVEIEEQLIPFQRGGKPIVFEGFDTTEGVYVRNDVARLKDGIPNPKVRPVIDLPWELQFTLLLLPNNEIQEAMIRDLFERGGIALGLGTYRGVFGKFVVEEWTKIE